MLWQPPRRECLRPFHRINSRSILSFSLFYTHSFLHLYPYTLNAYLISNSQYCLLILTLSVAVCHPFKYKPFPNLGLRSCALLAFWLLRFPIFLLISISLLPFPLIFQMGCQEPRGNYCITRPLSPITSNYRIWGTKRDQITQVRNASQCVLFFSLHRRIK